MHQEESLFQVLVKNDLLEFADLRIVTLVLVITIETINFECLINQNRLKIIYI